MTGVPVQPLERFQEGSLRIIRPPEPYLPEPSQEVRAASCVCLDVAGDVNGAVDDVDMIAKHPPDRVPLRKVAVTDDRLDAGDAV